MRLTVGCTYITINLAAPRATAQPFMRRINNDQGRNS
jgi:hypothetical protein